MAYKKIKVKAIFIALAIFLSLLLLLLLVPLVLDKHFFEGVVVDDLLSPHVVIDDLEIVVELADTHELRKQGLSNRESLDSDKGMLFVMPSRAMSSFWMKDMNFPLDIVWIDGDKVANISYDLEAEGPSPKKSYSSGSPVNYVLEVNAGFCKEHGIEVGDKVEIIY